MPFEAGPHFVRDRLTWVSYLMLACLSYTQGAFGPIMPFLRQERNLSFTLGGLLTAVLALGMITAGLTSDRMASRWGRRSVFWIGGAGLSIGAGGLARSALFPVMLASVLLMGFCGSLTLAVIQASLSDRHGERRTIAFAESNVAASFSASLAPLVIGGFQRAGAGWQGALFLPGCVWVLLAARFYREPIPDCSPDRVKSRAGGRTRLPAAFWAYWVLICLVVSIEWCLVVWGADYLEHIAGLSKVNASTTMGVFFAAMLLGRLIGSGLARILSGTTLLLIALGVASVGFPVFWLARLALLNIAGLFVAGLGVANLFPFALSVAVGTVPEQSNTASARVSLAVGVAILIAPLALGWLADGLGLQRAFALVVGWLIMAFALTLAARHWSAAYTAAPRA